MLSEKDSPLLMKNWQERRESNPLDKAFGVLSATIASLLLFFISIY